MNKYPPERKSAILKKLLPPHNRKVSDVAQEEGISEVTLYNWRKQTREEGKPVPGPNRTSDKWTPEAKLAVIIETSTLSEAELGQYCRSKGLYPEQVAQWKADCLSGGLSSPQATQEKSNTKAYKKQIRNLEKELNRKEKALAEAAALLVLRKKLEALRGNSSEDD